MLSHLTIRRDVARPVRQRRADIRSRREALVNMQCISRTMHLLENEAHIHLQCIYRGPCICSRTKHLSICSAYIENHASARERGTHPSAGHIKSHASARGGRYLSIRKAYREPRIRSRREVLIHPQGISRAGRLHEAGHLSIYRSCIESQASPRGRRLLSICSREAV